MDAGCAMWKVTWKCLVLGRGREKQKTDQTGDGFVGSLTLVYEKKKKIKLGVIFKLL